MHLNSNFEAEIKDALSGTTCPDPALNAVVKASLYRRQEELKEQPTRRLSLWWLPMTVNLLVCGVPAVIFALPGMPLTAHLAAFAFGWLALGGIALTLVGLKCSNLKEQLMIYLPPKRAGKEAH